MNREIDISDMINSISLYDILEKIDTDELIEELSDRILEVEDLENLEKILQAYDYR